MDSLHAKLITDKQLKRQVTLLSLFASEKSVVKLKELANILQVTTKTINKDLDDLLSKLPEKISYKVHLNYGIEFFWDDTFSLDNYIFKAISEAPLYQLLDGLYNGERVSFSEWANRFFISETTFRKYVNYLNQHILKEYGLKVVHHCLKLTGEEECIRLFYFNLYFRFKNRLKTEKIEQKYFDIYQDMTRSRLRPFENLSLDCHRASAWFMIVMQRSTKRHVVTMAHQTINEITMQPGYSVFKQCFFQKMEKYLRRQTLPESEVAYLYLALLNAIVYTESVGELDFTRTALPNQTILYDFVSKSLSRFYLDTDSLNLAIDRHYALLNNVHQLTKISDVFQKVSIEVKAYIFQNHHDLFQNWHDAILQNPQLNQLGLVYLEDIAISLTLITTSFLFQYKTIREHILISFSGEPGHVSLLTTMCKNLIPKGVKISIIFNEPVTNQFIKENNIDLFICNYELESTLMCTSLKLSYIPTVHEWGLLKTMLVNVT